MAKRNAQAAEAQPEQQRDPETQQRPDDRLTQAQEKLARMEAAQKLCFKHQNDLAVLADELQTLKFSGYEITQLLEPKGPRSLPGYLKSEIERQKQFVNYLSARARPADSHVAGIEQSRQDDNIPPL